MSAGNNSNIGKKSKGVGSDILRSIYTYGRAHIRFRDYFIINSLLTILFFVGKSRVKFDITTKGSGM